MTREKQIDVFANSQVDCEFFDESLHKGIIIGAKWADEHPKPATIYKKILKEWCEKNMNVHIDWNGFSVETNNTCLSIDEFVDKLWNYLEE